MSEKRKKNDLTIPNVDKNEKQLEIIPILGKKFNGTATLESSLAASCTVRNVLII